MRRREFISLLGAGGTTLLAASLVAYAQQQPDRMRRIGVLNPQADSPDSRTRHAAFQQELQRSGLMATTCGSTHAGAKGTPIEHTNTRPN
jgi:DNA-binding LacI/PurR family transcriptional regulator